MFIQYLGSVQVTRRIGVLSPIDFNYEVMVAAREVRDERANWQLAHEFQVTQSAIPQARPKPAFRIRHVNAESACFLPRPGSGVCHEAPSPHPLPQRERGSRGTAPPFGPSPLGERVG